MRDCKGKIKQIAIHSSFQSWLGNQIFVTSQRAQLQYVTDTPPRWAKAFTLVFLVTASSSCPELVHEAANRGLNWNCLCWGGDWLWKASPWKISTTQDVRCKKTFDSGARWGGERFWRNKSPLPEVSVTDARRRRFDAKHFQSGAFWGLQRSGRPPSLSTPLSVHLPLWVLDGWVMCDRGVKKKKNCLYAKRHFSQALL